MNYISRDLRIAVVGNSGCSALSAILSRQLEIPRISAERAGQEEGRPSSVHATMAAAAAGPSWIMEANDQVIRELIWPRATMIVWLDFHLSRNLRARLRRGVGRLLAGVGRRRDHTVVEPRPGSELDQLLDERCVRLRSLGDIRDWLRDIAR